MAERKQPAPEEEGVEMVSTPKKEKKEMKQREQKIPAAPPIVLSPKSMRSIMAALKKSVKQFMRDRTAEEKLANAPIPQIRAQQTDSIDEKKLETYLNANESVRDQLIAMIRDIPDVENKKADQLKADILRILKENKQLVFQLLFTAKTAAQQTKVKRAASKKERRAEAKTAKALAVAPVAERIPQADRLKDLPPPVTTPVQPATAAAIEQGPVLELDPSIDGKHTPAAGEVRTIQGQGFEPLTDREAKVAISGITLAIPEAMRAGVRATLGRFRGVLTGETDINSFIETMSPVAASALLVGLMGMPGDKRTQLESITNLLIAGFRSTKSLAGLISGPSVNPSVNELKVGGIRDDADTSNRGNILRNLQNAQGELQKRINEGKANEGDMETFRDATRILQTSSVENATPAQVRNISMLASAFKKKPVQEALRMTNERLQAASTPIEGRVEIVEANPDLFRSTPLDVYNTIEFLSSAPEAEGLSLEEKKQVVFNIVTEGKQLDEKAGQALIQSSNLGAGLERGEEILLRASPEDRKAIADNVRTLSAASLGAINTFLQGGSWLSGMAAASGALLGAGMAARVGEDLPPVGKTLGAAIAGAGMAAALEKGEVGKIFREKKIEFERIPVEQVTVEQQDDIKNAANAIKGSGTLKPKFIVPAASAFKPTPAEASADQVEFDMFDYIRPTAEGDGFTIAESNIKMAAYRNEQLRMNGGGMTYAPSWGENSFDAQDEPINPRVTEAMVRGNVIPTADLRLPAMEEDFGDYEVEEHIWNPNVGLQRLYAPQPTPITGLNTTINRSLLYGIVP